MINYILNFLVVLFYLSMLFIGQLEKIFSFGFWENFDFWAVIIGFVNIGVLFWTLLWLKRSTIANERSTIANEKMAEHQMTPVIDVYMNYHPEEKGTSFWFSNSSNIPAFVTLELTINSKKHPRVALRIPPNNPYFIDLKRTAITYEYWKDHPNEDVKAILKVKVVPAFDNSPIKSYYTKEYEFKKEVLQWYESTWQVPDPSYPLSIIGQNN